MGFDDLREKLLKGGIAPRHVRRYLRELNEHLDDLIREQHEAGYDSEDARLRARARLGSDDELATAMLAQKGFRSIAARAPWAVFVLLPPVAALAFGALFVCSLALIGKCFGFMPLSDHATPPWFQTLAASFVAVANLTAKPLAAILFVVIAARQRLKLIWPLIATLLLLVLVVDSHVLFAAPGKSQLRLGAGLALLPQAWRAAGQNWFQIGAQYLLTMLPVLWLYKVRRRIA